MEKDREALLDVVTVGRPYLLIVVDHHSSDPDGLRLEFEIGNGIDDDELTEALLEKALAAIRQARALSGE